MSSLITRYTVYCPSCVFIVRTPDLRVAEALVWAHKRGREHDARIRDRETGKYIEPVREDATGEGGTGAGGAP